MHIQHTALATAATTASLVACTITKIQGSKLAANDRYLQLHDTKATPSAAAVPVRVWPIYGTSPFGEAFIVQPVALTNGATFVVSTTQNTYTATAETIDITVDGNAAFDSTGVSYAGDYTTARETLTVWNNAAGPKTLLRIEATDLAGVAVYLMVFAKDTPVVNDVPPIPAIPLPASGSIDRLFNYSPNTFASQAITDACVIVTSTSANFYNPTAQSDYYIKATYK